MPYQLIVFVLGLAVAVLAAVQVRKIRPKIIGGIHTDIENMPYIVSLKLDNSHRCGGSIIHPSWILTAAHCTTKGTATNYSIRAGASLHFWGGVLVQVSKIIQHPFFEDDDTYNFDAALLELETPLKLSEFIQPIPLTETGLKEGDLILISGWGRIGEHGHASKTLQSTWVPIVSRHKCKKAFKSVRYVAKHMFCAGFDEGGKDACKGDSGGPAVFNGNQVGIVSWGLKCGLPNTPGVYTNVTWIKLWIESQIRTRETFAFKKKLYEIL